MKKKSERPIDTRRLETARDYIHKAIGEILLSNGGVEMAAEVNALYRIEDVLWQYSHQLSGERSEPEGASAERKSRRARNPRAVTASTRGEKKGA